jgi:hypothetical protein
MKIEKIIRIIFGIIVFLIAVLFGQILFAQDLPVDVNATTHRVFATNADNVYGTLVGILFFALIGVLFLLYYIISRFLPILDGLKNALNGNTSTIANSTEELKEVQKYLESQFKVILELLSLKLESKLDSMRHDIINSINNKT